MGVKEIIAMVIRNNKYYCNILDMWNGMRNGVRGMRNGMFNGMRIGMPNGMWNEI